MFSPQWTLLSPATTNTSQGARRPSLPGSPFDAPEGATPQAPPKIGHPSLGSSSPGFHLLCHFCQEALPSPGFRFALQQGEGPAGVHGGRAVPEFSSAYLLAWQTLRRLGPDSTAGAPASLESGSWEVLLRAQIRLQSRLMLGGGQPGALGFAILPWALILGLLECWF